MPLTRQAIDELKEIYQSEFAVDLPDDEAWALGHRLLRLFAVLTRSTVAGSHAPDEVRSQSQLTERGGSS